VSDDRRYANELLHRPAAVHESRRKTINQLRQFGTLAKSAEFFRCSTQSFAKQMLPCAIHRRARDERRLRGIGSGQPVCKLQTTARRIAFQIFMVVPHRLEADPT
jgi:hypothetical protein